jgi:hypothetical protein
VVVTINGVRVFITALIQLSGPCEPGFRLTASNVLPLFPYQLHNPIK